MYENVLISGDSIFQSPAIIEQERFFRQEGIIPQINKEENYFLEEIPHKDNFFIKSYNSIVKFLYNKIDDREIEEIINSKIHIDDKIISRNRMPRTSQFSAFYTYTQLCSIILTNFKHSPHYREDLYQKLDNKLRDFLTQAYKLSRESSNMQKGYK